MPGTMGEDAGTGPEVNASAFDNTTFNNSTFNGTEGDINGTGITEEPPEMAIPAVLLPVLAIFIIAAVLFFIKKAVDFAETLMPKTENEIKFEQKLPQELFDKYEKKKEEYEAGLIVKKEVMQVLMERAVHDLNSAMRLQNEAKSLRQAEMMGKLPTSLRDDFMKARKDLDEEINYVKAEAEDLEPGFGEKIIEIASNQVKSAQEAQKKNFEKAMDQNIEQFKKQLANNPNSPKLTEEQMKRQVAQQMQQRMMVQRFIETLKQQGATKEQIVEELRKRNVNVQFQPEPAAQSPRAKKNN